MVSSEDVPTAPSPNSAPDHDDASPQEKPQLSTDNSQPSEFTLKQYTPSQQPDLDPDATELPDFQLNSVKVVEYHPGQKAQRLGRPRRHIVGSDATTKSDTFANESKAYGDDLSVDGSGSYGGDSHKSPRAKNSGASRKRMAQAQLDLGGSSVELADTKRPRRATRLSQKAREAQANQAAAQELEAAKLVTVKTEPTEEVITTTSTTANVTNAIPEATTKLPTESETKLAEATSPSTPSTTTTSTVPSESKFRLPPAPPTPSAFGSVSRTGLTPRVENKLCRQLPGPVTGIHYNLYDDNFINKPSVSGDGLDAITKNIAAGFTVTPAKYAADIVYILEFLNKFRDIVGIDGLSPQSFEKGLGLTSRAPRQSKFTASFVSPDMQSVFLKLLALVLNRKKEVVSQASAIMELRPQAVTLGLAKEWKRTVVVKVDADGQSVEVTTGDEVVKPMVTTELMDASRPDMPPQPSPNLYRHYIEYNPFDDPEFEQEGLAMLSPENRLIMLRTLVHWAMSQSDQIRSVINSEYQTFEMSGDKDTLYAARIVLLGPQNCEEMKKEAEIKLNRRKAEEAEKYVDPTSNPLEHGLRLRLVEGFAGDGGAFIGRFYISGMLDPNTGGLASMDKMRQVWEAPEASGPQTRRRRGVAFKLYVQDVHKMLGRAYTNDGIEFDAYGNEVESSVVDSSEQEEWYEVASNSEELSQFVHYLGRVLGHDSGENGTIKHETDESAPSLPFTCGVYSSLTHLHRYLSHLLPVLQHNEVPV